MSAKLDWKISDSVDFYVKGYYHDWDTHYTTLFNSHGDRRASTWTRTTCSGASTIAA